MKHFVTENLINLSQIDEIDEISGFANDILLVMNSALKSKWKFLLYVWRSIYFYFEIIDEL